VNAATNSLVRCGRFLRPRDILVANDSGPVPRICPRFYTPNWPPVSRIQCRRMFSCHACLPARSVEARWWPCQPSPFDFYAPISRLIRPTASAMDEAEFVAGDQRSFSGGFHYFLFSGLSHNLLTCMPGSKTSATSWLSENASRRIGQKCAIMTCRFHSMYRRNVGIWKIPVHGRNHSPRMARSASGIAVPISSQLRHCAGVSQPAKLPRRHYRAQRFAGGLTRGEAGYRTSRKGTRRLEREHIGYFLEPAKCRWRAKAAARWQRDQEHTS